MVLVRLDYGDGEFSVNIPEKNLLGVLRPNDLPGVDSEKEIQRAVVSPVQSRRLRDIAARGDKVAIVVTDNTRRCPDHEITPVILKELETAGVRNEDITVVLGLGTHRKMRDDEIVKKLGKTVCERARIENHDCGDEGNLCYLGTTSRLGTPVWINKTVAQADVKISTGVVEFHTFAGYSGGRKSVSVGVAGKETIVATHNARTIDQPNVGVGILKNNPIHEDMVEVARLVGVDFIVNVVLNGRDEIVRAAAGDLVKAHEELTVVYDRMYKVEAPDTADIAIAVPSFPKNINLYQATRAPTNLVLTANPVLERGGTVIVPALCRDGIGSKVFYEWMRTAKSPQQVIERAYRETNEIVIKPLLLAKILCHAKVTVTNAQLSDQILLDMHLTPCKNVQAGMEKAIREAGPDSKILVLLHAISTLPCLSSP